MMAEEKTATSSHLDSYMHVYDDGTTGRLYVTPWDRNTVADGHWQTVNTIQPLINRDIYLAEALDKLASQYVVYEPGYGIDMEYDTVDDTWTISVDADEVLGSVQKYDFDGKYFTCEPIESEDNSYEVGIKVKSDGFISANDDGLFCNVDKLISSTSSLSSFSSVSSNTMSSFSYDYNVSEVPINLRSSFSELDSNIQPFQLYLIG